MLSGEISMFVGLNVFFLTGQITMFTGQIMIFMTEITMKSPADMSCSPATYFTHGAPRFRPKAASGRLEGCPAASNRAAEEDPVGYGQDNS